MEGLNKDTYNEHAKAYGEFADESFSWQFIERPAFDDLISELCSSETKLLDIGCGNGRVIKHLISKGLSPSNTFGIDPSDEMLSLARARRLDTNLIKGVATELPFENDYFDLVISNMVFHQLNTKQLRQSFAEMSRVLKPNGALFFVDSFLLTEGKEGQLIIKKTPWGKDIGMFVHDFDKLFTDEKFLKDLKLEHSGILKVKPEGNLINSAEYQKYSTGSFRYTAKLIK